MIIPYITNKQQQIPKLIYRFRFLNTEQIQRYLGHKDKSRINKWLKNLFLKNYLGRIYDPKTFGQNTKLAIYYSGLNSIRFLKIQEGFVLPVLLKLYHDRKRSDSFIQRCIFIADCCLWLQKQSNGSVHYSFETESDYVNPSSLFYFLTKLGDHTPNLGITEHKGRNKVFYLLSIIDSTLPRYRIRSRIRLYISFYFSNTWEDHVSKSFPIFLIIAPDKPGLIYAKRYAKKVLEQNQHPKDLHLAFAIADEVKKYGVMINIWEEAK